MRRLGLVVGLVIVATGCGTETRVVSGTDCSASETDGCAVIECPNGDPVSVCGGEDGQDGEQGLPGSAGEPGEDGAIGPEGPPGDDGQDGAQGDEGPQGPAGQDGVVVAVKNFELADIDSGDLDTTDCTFTDDPEFAGIYTPLNVEAGQRLVVFTEFFGATQPKNRYTVTPYIQLTGDADQALRPIRVELVSVSGTLRTTRGVYNSLSVTEPLAAGQYTFGMCIVHGCSPSPLCDAALARDNQMTVMRLAD